MTMLSRYSTGSTTGEVDYSGGLLHRHYEEPWDLAASRFYEPLNTSVEVTVSSPKEHLSLLMTGEDRTNLVRAVGCLIILSMPEAGLNEAVTSLMDVRKFYREVPELSLPPKRSAHQLAGKVGISRKRPDLVIEG